LTGIEPPPATNNQSQHTRAILVTPACPGAPTAQANARFLRHIRKRPIVIVMVETVLAVVRHVDIWPAIVVVIAHSHAEAPALVRHAYLGRYIGESAIVIVAQQHSARGWFSPLQGSKCGAIEQIDVQPAIVVIIKEGHAGAGCLEDSCFLGSPRAMAEFVQACLFRDVDEYDWGVVHK